MEYGPLDVGLRLAAVLALVLANGFFVAAEFALVTVRKTRVDQLIAEGNRMARSVRLAVNDPDNFIAATQLGITMASLGLGSIGEPFVARTLEPLFAELPAPLPTITPHSVALTVAFACITALHIVLGELAPKTIALQYAEKTSLVVVKPTQWFMRIFWPFIALLNGMGRGAVRLLGLKGPSGHALVHSEEELKMLVTASQEAGVLEEDEEQMLHRVFGFGDLTAGQVMLPRTEMATISAEATLAQVIELVSREPHLWIPVHRNSPDDIVGVLYVKDLFPVLSEPPAEFRLLDLTRETAHGPGDDERRRRAERDAAEAHAPRDRDRRVRRHRRTRDLHGADGANRRRGERRARPPRGAASRSCRTDRRWWMVWRSPRMSTSGSACTSTRRSTTRSAGTCSGELGRRPRLGDRVEVEGRTMRVEALDGLRVARVLLAIARGR